MPSAGDIINASDISSIVGVQLGTPAAPVVTSIGTGPTSGTTELRDSNLGDYVFTVPAAQATYRYRAMYFGVNGIGTVVNDRFAMNVRDGGGSTPTAASTAWGTNSVKIIYASGGNGDSWITFPTFVPGAGVHHLGIFYVRISGTGTFTASGTREFYVECVGPN